MRYIIYGIFCYIAYAIKPEGLLPMSLFVMALGAVQHHYDIKDAKLSSSAAVGSGLENRSNKN